MIKNTTSQKSGSSLFEADTATKIKIALITLTGLLCCLVMYYVS